MKHAVTLEAVHTHTHTHTLSNLLTSRFICRTKNKIDIRNKDRPYKKYMGLPFLRANYKTRIDSG